MKISTHTHPRYIVWLKYFIFGSAIVLPLNLIYIDFVEYPHSESVISKVLYIIFITLLWSVVMLISAYYFGQNITVTDEGLLIEFLGKELAVSWEEIVDIKPVYAPRIFRNQKRIFIVLTNALTPFHHLLGLIYGSSSKPAFIIPTTISEYQSLVETIKSHVKKN